MKHSHDDKPEFGKQYRLTGGSDDKAISNGHSWAESEVSNGSLSPSQQANVGKVKNRMASKMQGGTSGLKEYRKKHPKGGPLNEHPSVKRFKEIRGY